MISYLLILVASKSNFIKLHVKNTVSGKCRWLVGTDVAVSHMGQPVPGCQPFKTLTLLSARLRTHCLAEATRS